MGLDIRSSLDTLKRKALSVILQNVKVNSYTLQNKLDSYIKDGGIFSPLVSSYAFKSSIVSSSQMNAVLMFAYLDFYATYTIMYSNYLAFTTLRDVAKNKYTYIANLHKELCSIIEAKQYNRYFSSIFYNNFLSTSNVDIQASVVNTRSGVSANILNYSPFLSLPVIKSREVSPMSIVCYDDDFATHESDNKSTNSYIRYFIYRSQNNKIGIPTQVVLPASNNSSISNPEIMGTTFGYYTDMLYVLVTGIEYESDNISGITIKSSTNGFDYSSDLTVPINTFTKVKTERDIEPGISIKFSADLDSIAEGDSWRIPITNTHVTDPKLVAKLRFNLLEQVSYLTYSDLSSFELKHKDQQTILGRTEENYMVKERSFDDPYKIVTAPFIGNPETVSIIHSPLDEYKVIFEQQNGEAKSRNGKLVYEYNFKIDNVKAVIRKYRQDGAITFVPFDINDISSIMLEEDEYIPNKYYSVGQVDQKSFIEYNLIVNTTSDYAIVPMLQQNRENRCETVLEYIVPSKVAGSSATYRTRFPIDVLQTQRVVSLTTGTPYSVTLQQDHRTIIFDSYSTDDVFAVEYTPLVHTISEAFSVNSQDTYNGTDLIWNVADGGNIYYMYYRDVNSDLRLAIRNKKVLLDASDYELTSFNGSIAENIEMRSIEEDYISPIVFKSKILCS